MTRRSVRSSAQDIKQLLLEALSHEVRTWKVAQGEAARRLGTDRVALNGFLHGRRMPSLEALLSYADAAGMTFHFTLESRSGAMTVQSHGANIDKNDVIILSKGELITLSQQYE